MGRDSVVFAVVWTETMHVGSSVDRNSECGEQCGQTVYVSSSGTETVHASSSMGRDDTCGQQWDRDSACGQQCG